MVIQLLTMHIIKMELELVKRLEMNIVITLYQEIEFYMKLQVMKLSITSMMAQEK